MVYLDKQQTSTKDDKRRYDRRHSLYYLRLYDTTSGEFIGNLVDLSEGGMMMVGDKPLNHGEIYSLSMQLPEPVGDKNRIEFEAKAKWSKQEANPNLFDTGLELTNSTPDHFDIIKRLIDGYMFNSFQK